MIVSPFDDHDDYNDSSPLNWLGRLWADLGQLTDFYNIFLSGVSSSSGPLDRCATALMASEQRHWLSVEGLRI